PLITTAKADSSGWKFWTHKNVSAEVKPCAASSWKASAHDVTQQSPSATNYCRMITRQIVADKIADYLYGKVSQADLVDWAERAMMDADFDEADTDLLTDIVGRLGLADVAEFGLRWQDCEEFLRRLGYRAKVIVSTE